MKKKRYAVILLLLLLFPACAGQKQETGPAEKAEEGTAALVTATPVTKTPEAFVPDGGYKSALSESELETVKDLAAEFYKKEFPYKLVSIREAEDNDPAYGYYPDYSPGNIIVFKVKTTHEGDGDLYRDIIYGRIRSDSDWERLNEGY